MLSDERTADESRFRWRDVRNIEEGPSGRRTEIVRARCRVRPRVRDVRESATRTTSEERQKRKPHASIVCPGSARKSGFTVAGAIVLALANRVDVLLPVSTIERFDREPRDVVWGIETQHVHVVLPRVRARLVECVYS